MSANAVGLFVLCSFLPTLSTLAVGARFHVRNIKAQKFDTDDWTALFGLIGLWAVAGLIIHSTRRDLFGGNSDLDPLTGELIRSSRDGPNVMYSWIVTTVTVVALTPIKISVVFLYRRIFHISRSFHYYSIFTCVLLISWALAFLFASIFQCGKRPWAYWTTVETIALFCYDTGTANVAMCFSDLIIDILILIAPLIMIWKMSFTPRRKIQIASVFALGFMSTAAAATRTYIMWEDAYSTKRGHTNLIRENTKVTMWCLIEISSANIACCLPVLRPLFVDSWISHLVCRLPVRIYSKYHTSGPSDRTIEEGIASRSIGGTGFRVAAKHDIMSREDMNVGTNARSAGVDPEKDRDGSAPKQLAQSN